MQSVHPVIKWSGSKRSQARKIAANFPVVFGTYFEPFLGGGSVLGFTRPKKAVCGDICSPLIEIWRMIQKNVDVLADGYEKRWSRLQEMGPSVYYDIRDSFNKTKAPEDLLFLSRTCVNGLIRFNKDGDFNNSFHLSRKGIDPLRLRKILKNWSDIISEYKFYSADYRDTTSAARRNDLIYLDPPYFHTKGRYFGAIPFDEFIEYLYNLNRRGVRYALSFDGSRGPKTYAVEIPKELYKSRSVLHSGNSTFNKVQKVGIEPVFESLYLNY